MTRAATLVASTGYGRGIGFTLVSYACFSTADAIIKLVSERFSVFQIGCLLAFFALGPVVLLARGQGGLQALVPHSWRLVLLRGVLVSACALLCWQAFALLPLADSYAILFTSPIMVTLLSVPLLGEQVGWRRWLAAGVGFGGVLLMIRPDFAGIGLGHGLAVLAAILSALSLIVLRKAGPRERSAALLFGLFGTLFLVTLPMTVAEFVPPTPRELFLLALAGLLQGAGQTGLVLATREAPASVVAPFQYSQMLWGVLFGVLLFQDQPTPILFVGLAIVILSGLYSIWRETLRQGPVSLGVRGEAPARAAR